MTLQEAKIADKCFKKIYDIHVSPLRRADTYKALNFLKDEDKDNGRHVIKDEYLSLLVSENLINSTYS
ncbi:hypothetical protein [Psychroflexus sediminis]|uniref:Uncharacterized protein n=1 Tax=Psychroflexus sediminis TaxID=470826 RepID=A0A1G7UN94_9FLAO|nr:hypothetical protein [Psychroflexus sediminis]SDG48200.1 hypothetical protein SAMN04488027_102141 [Psychroflexus sediminis]